MKYTITISERTHVPGNWPSGCLVVSISNDMDNNRARVMIDDSTDLAEAFRGFGDIMRRHYSTIEVPVS